MARDEAARAYLRRIHEKIPVFETMTEKDLNFVKLINAGERMELNNASFGYLSMRVIFFLMNLHTKTRTFYFARAGVSSDTEHFKADATLCAEGAEYAKKMSDCVIKHREACHAASIAQGAPDEPLRPMLVWTSTRKRTIETAEYLASLGYKVLQRSQMSQLDPGVCEKMTDEQIRREYPDEVKKHEIDPYHHRFPRAEVSSQA
jgi:6-phosphofructo-2-kinase/fructose-2,6-biphosphatase 4